MSIGDSNLDSPIVLGSDPYRLALPGRGSVSAEVMRLTPFVGDGESLFEFVLLGDDGALGAEDCRQAYGRYEREDPFLRHES